MNDNILSCDWGTSSFRLRLIDRRNKRNLGEINTSQGIAKTSKAWEVNKEMTRLEFFKHYLYQQITDLSTKLSQKLDNIPVFLSGMASSSIGMFELPYAQLPLQLSGEGLIWKQFDASDRFPHEIYLISGVQTEKDVMRGEEMQIIGLANSFKVSSSISIFPGTHSKHIHVQDHQITNFQTYMTGEIFQLMVQHSILGASVEKSNAFEANHQAFSDGVQESVKSNLLHGLFTTRTTELLRKTSKIYNYYYLSGLIIGYELRALVDTDIPVFLCGGNKLSLLYEKALQCLNLHSVQVLSAEMVEGAVSEGHLVLADKVLPQSR